MEASEKLILESTSKVGLLQAEVSSFINDFRSAHEADVASMNKVICSFRDSLKEEKAALSTLRNDLRSENNALSESINAKMVQLQNDLALENKIMDTLALHTQRVKVKSAQLTQARETISELTNQTTVIRSCVSDANSLLRKIVETNDSVLTPSVRNHLTSKLQPAFSLLDRIIGVSGSGPSPHQGGEAEEDVKPEIHTAETSKPQKRKKKIGEDDDDSDNEALAEERLKRQKRDKELDELNKQ